MMTWEALHYAGLKNLNILFFVFFATLLTYHVHSMINVVYPASTTRHHWNDDNRNILLVFIALAFTGTLVFFIPFITTPAPFLLAGLLTFLYSAPNLKAFAFLRSIAVGKTFYLAFMWTYATAILPVIGLQPQSPDLLNPFTASRFFLVYAICILFDRRDKKEDQAKGIKALPTLLSEKSIGIIYYISLLISIYSAVMFTWPSFNTTTLFLVLPSVICLFLFSATRHRKGDVLYYVLLDGLMMMSAVLQAIYLFSFTFVIR
jgi:4-hydroxybenzoate polyprenyltransferase